MKRTILATAILATSFGSIASESNPGEPMTDNAKLKLAAAHKALNSDNLNSIFRESDDFKIEKIDDVWSFVHYKDGVAESAVPVDPEMRDKMDDQQLNTFIRNVKRAGEENHEFRLEPTDPITIDPLPAKPDVGTPELIEKIKEQFQVGIPPLNPIEDTRPIHNTETKVAAFNKVMDNHDFDAEIVQTASVDGTGTYVLQMEDKTTGELVEIDLGENADEAIARAAEVRATIKEKVQGHNPGVEPIDPGFGSDPLPGVPQGERAQAAAEALTESGESLIDSGKAAAQQAAKQQNQIDELYALGNQNANDIDTLFSEVDRLDTRIDQTQALNAATVNARPMVTNGMTAFGAGVGYAGSEAALAIGVAHAFVDTGWSASGTLAASSDDVVVGAGAQYAF